MQYPKIMQPTHARWEELPAPSAASRALRLSGNGADGALVDGAVNHDRDDETVNGDHEQEAETIFPPVRPLYSRNFLIVDTHFVGPSMSDLGVPGPDGDVVDVEHRGLTDVPDDVRSELPPDCLQAFVEAKDAELTWKNGWATETEDGLRAKFKVDYNLSG